jgi:hypothetical protein
MLISSVGPVKIEPAISTMHSLSPDNTSLEPKHSRVIELELRGLSLLFNSINPSPIENKNLNHDVEEFIVFSLEEYRPDFRRLMRRGRTSLLNGALLPCRLFLLQARSCSAILEEPGPVSCARV